MNEQPSQVRDLTISPHESRSAPDGGKADNSNRRAPRLLGTEHQLIYCGKSGYATTSKQIDDHGLKVRVYRQPASKLLTIHSL